MFIFKRKTSQTLNDLDAYISGLGDEPIKLLAREIKSWGEIDYTELVQAIEDGRLDELLDWQNRYANLINKTLDPIWSAAIITAAERSSKGFTVLEASDWYVQNFLRERGGLLISQLSDDSRKAIAAVLRLGQGTGKSPREIAQEIRPLIGLTERQMIANQKYRDQIFNRYIEEGAKIDVANDQAQRAALRYAAKQHRQRAETIVLTENAFAYNYGAHEGITRAIKNGYMIRCEMIWSTAGTNRVCGRCLDLKDTVVGYTDEVGVQLPPLHPRCRCAIKYREVGGQNAKSIRGIERQKRS